MNFIEKQLNRKSERNLDPNKLISKEIIKKLKEVVSSAPTSINGQGASVIFIQKQEIKDKISQWNWGQEHIRKAPLVILFMADMNRLKYAYEKVGVSNWRPMNKNFMELLLVGTVDATIKAQAVADAALSLGMGSCYIGGVRTFQKKLIDELNLPDFVVPIVALTVGYTNSQEEVKPKLNVVFDEKYNDEQMKNELDKYDTIMKDYFTNRGTNKKEKTWSENTTQLYDSFFKNNLYDGQSKLLKSKFKKIRQ